MCPLSAALLYLHDFAIIPELLQNVQEKQKKFRVKKTVHIGIFTDKVVILLRDCILLAAYYNYVGFPT